MGSKARQLQLQLRKCPMKGLPEAQTQGARAENVPDIIDGRGGYYEPPKDNNRTPLVSSFEQYKEMYRRSVEQPEEFWTEMAECHVWHEKWDTVRSFNFDIRRGPVSIRYFEGGKTNVAFNCIDRHLYAKGEQTAIVWEGNQIGENRKLTYNELHEQVCRCANVCLRSAFTSWAAALTAGCIRCAICPGSRSPAAYRTHGPIFVLRRRMSFHC